MLERGAGQAGRHSVAYLGDQRVRSAAPGATAAHHQPKTAALQAANEHCQLFAAEQLEDTSIVR